MKYFVAILASCFLILNSSKPVLALYDPRTIPNNKAGIHVLETTEIEKAAEIVNHNGGEWGYVTIPIQPSDRDIDKWQAFMDKAKELKIIPIIRITTIPQGGTWEKGQDTDLVDFANFLGELHWPIENRYIVLFNEVNRSAEWGGEVNPEKYASIVKNAYTIFKERSQDYFLLGPALDDALPNSASSMSAINYVRRMAAYDPLIWTYFDGWAAHSYPNPGFIASPTKTGAISIVSYREFFKQLKIASKPTFITETGWDQTKLSEQVLRSNWQTAWNIWLGDEQVIAVTPFILQGGEMFKPFSLVGSDGQLTASGQVLKDLTKVKGQPKEGSKSAKSSGNLDHQSGSATLPWLRTQGFLLELENVFRVILGFPEKKFVTIGTQTILVEMAQTAKQWEKGLSNRDKLDGIDGMLFLFPYTHVPVFWMKETKIALDMIWIGEGKVKDITRDVPVVTSDKLPTYSPSVPVDTVLEVPAGWSERNNVQIGDTLTL